MSLRLRSPGFSIKARATVAALILSGAFPGKIGANPVDALPYTGKVTWDADERTVSFTTSGEMPPTKDGFYWSVPSEVRRVSIGEGVIFTGGIRVGFRDKSNPLDIVGEDRSTSIIFGTLEEAWTTKHSVPENDKWTYGAVSVTADALVNIANLTSKNPRAYHISGYANNSVIHVDNCSLLDTRGGDNNNSDGFAGSSGSSIRNSMISTADDAIKIYKDITIEDVTIEQHRNGAAIQFGWGGGGDATAEIRNLTIEGVNPEGLYNMAPFTWEGGRGTSRTVNVDGLRVRFAGQVFDESSESWAEAGLFELKPDDCALHFRATGADLDGLGLGRRETRGTTRIEHVSPGEIHGVDGD